MRCQMSTRVAYWNDKNAMLSWQILMCATWASGFGQKNSGPDYCLKWSILSTLHLLQVPCVESSPHTGTQKVRGWTASGLSKCLAAEETIQGFMNQVEPHSGKIVIWNTRNEQTLRQKIFTFCFPLPFNIFVPNRYLALNRVLTLELNKWEAGTLRVFQCASQPWKLSRILMNQVEPHSGKNSYLKYQEWTNTTTKKYSLFAPSPFQ